jgi:serine/threonine protein kinase
MDPSESGRPTAHYQWPKGTCGAADPEETGIYRPVAGSQPAATVPAELSATGQRFDFFSPPRAAGELGWLAHYRVIRLLGEGGMGLVFLAEDTLLARPVALKLIRPEIAYLPTIAQRFMREARATAAIKHDHIVTIYQVGQQHGFPFLTMEYLKGASLSHWLDKGHSPPVNLVLRIGREIASGLSAAHRHGLIHRDIKPANIWLEAPTGRVKILDFGMARSQREDVEISHSGTVLGTPAFMAPEQARGESVGAGSDLFSLGCVMYRLSTGRLPFEGESVMAILSALLRDIPRRPGELNPGLPPALEQLVMRLMAKDVADRPASAEEVVQSIRSIERALAAERQKLGLTAATPPTTAIGPGKETATDIGRLPAPSRSASRRRELRRRIGIATALTAALAAAALGGIELDRLARRPSEFVAARTAAITRPGQSPVPLRAAPSRTGAQEAHAEQKPEQREPRENDSLASEKPFLSRPQPQNAAAAIAPVVARPTQAGPAVRSKPTEPPTKDPSTALRGASDLGSDQEQPVTGSAEKQTPARQSPPVPEQPAWGYWVDPDGDCQSEVDPRHSKVTFVVPGKAHLLSAEIGRMNAPRMLREIKGDFDVSARVASISQSGGKATTTIYAPFHGAGILVWQDSRNYVRLEIASDLLHGKTRPYVNFEYRKEGALAASSGKLNSDRSNQLRLRRRGDEISAAYSPDGAHWTSFAPLSARLNSRLEVGIVAINSSTKPLTAELEGLRVLEAATSRENGADSGTNPRSTKNDDRPSPR